MDERKESRWNLMLFLPLHDAGSGELLGYIADISDHGVLLFSAGHIELGVEYAAVIYRKSLEEAMLANGINGDIHFFIRSHWVDFDIKPAFHRTGFQLKDVTQENHDKIEQLVINVASNVMSSA